MGIAAAFDDVQKKSTLLQNYVKYFNKHSELIAIAEALSYTYPMFCKIRKERYNLQHVPRCAATHSKIFDSLQVTLRLDKIKNNNTAVDTLT